MLLYLCLNIGLLGVLPWEKLAESATIGAAVMESTWGKTTAQAFTGLIIITAFASLFTGFLGASRVPYNAARDKLFFSAFGRLHPRLNFPHVALLVMGVATAIGSFFSLDDVIALLTAVIVLVQAIAQIVALTVLRRRQPELRRPYRMWLYPLPSILALVGWIFVYLNSGRLMIELSVAWVTLGVIAFLIWAKLEKTWPFGPKEIREEFLQAQRAADDPRVVTARELTTLGNQLFT
jgi:amino acid transporter